MMFSRMAPTVLFTAFCVALAGVYVADERPSLSHPGTVDPAYMKAITAFSDEMALALQVGDRARFRALLDSQVNAMSGLNEVADFDRDTLPVPYAALRDIVMHGDAPQLRQFLAAHPGLSLNTAQGRYQSVPLFWATANYSASHDIIKTLLDAGADPGFTTQNGYSLAHAMATPFAVALGATAIDTVLAAMPPALIDAPADSGATPFLLALVNGRSPLALALLELGGDPNLRSPKGGPEELMPGEPALILAGADVALVEALLFAGADPLAHDADGTPVLTRISQDADAAQAMVQDRLKASEAEEWDRRYAADYARVREMVRAAADGRLAKDG